MNQVIVAIQRGSSTIKSMLVRSCFFDTVPLQILYVLEEHQAKIA